MALDFSDFDRRGYPTLDVRDGYGLWSRTYDEAMVAEMDLPLLARLESVDWSAARRAVDLACGTGRIGQWLAERGVAEIFGVDITPEMLEIAGRRNVYKHLLEEDIRSTSLADAEADLVVNVLSNEHLADMGPFYREAARLVTATGTLVVVGYHPDFLLRGIPTHFRDETGANLAIESHIHLLCDQVSAARVSGWGLVELEEQVVDYEWVGRRPNWDKHLGHPITFAMVWRRLLR